MHRLAVPVAGLIVVLTVCEALAQDNVPPAFGAFMGLMQGMINQAQQQQALDQLRNSPEYRDQEIQPGGLTRGQVIIVQQLLNERGYNVGAADGVIGPKTRAAVAQLQQRAGVPITGYPTPQLLQALLQAQNSTGN